MVVFLSSYLMKPYGCKYKGNLLVAQEGDGTISGGKCDRLIKKLISNRYVD
jgi:hypothetical protein